MRKRGDWLRCDAFCWIVTLNLFRGQPRVVSARSLGQSLRTRLPQAAGAEEASSPLTSQQRSGALFFALVASRACARQQNFIDHVDHAIAGLNVSNDDIGHITGTVRDGNTRMAGDAQTL